MPEWKINPFHFHWVNLHALTQNHFIQAKSLISPSNYSSHVNKGFPLNVRYILQAKYLTPLQSFLFSVFTETNSSYFQQREGLLLVFRLGNLVISTYVYILVRWLVKNLNNSKYFNLAEPANCVRSFSFYENIDFFQLSFTQTFS